jgi:large subunit ribosomal protein L11
VRLDRFAIPVSLYKTPLFARVFYFCYTLYTTFSNVGENLRGFRKTSFSFPFAFFSEHMAAKKVKTIVKLNLPAGEATAAPPVGPALGQHGLPIMEFVKAYNERTAKLKGETIPAVITVYEDRTFSFITKLPPVAAMIKKLLSLDKAGGKAGHESAGTLTRSQVKQIATTKLPDLNTDSVEAAMKVVEGTARSMGIEVK